MHKQSKTKRKLSPGEQLSKREIKQLTSYKEPYYPPGWLSKKIGIKIDDNNCEPAEQGSEFNISKAKANIIHASNVNGNVNQTINIETLNHEAINCLTSKIEEIVRKCFALYKSPD